MKTKNWHESEWTFESDITPFQKGQYYGPPENCYPEEGGYARIEYGTLGKCTWEREFLIEHAMFSERELSDLEDDIYQEYLEAEAA